MNVAYALDLVHTALSRGAVAAITAVLIVAGRPAAAGATTVVNYPDFTTVRGITLNGSANHPGNALRLTNGNSSEAGSAFFNQPLPTSSSFESSFRLQIASTGAPLGDGMAFVLQNAPAGASSLGGSGGGLGYVLVAPSVAVEFDTFQNPENGDPNGNHVAVLTNGKMDSLSPVPLSFPLSPSPLEPRFVWIAYDASLRSLSVYVNAANAKPAAPLITYPINLATAIGPQMYLGFSGGTGGAVSVQDVLGWTVSGPGASLAQQVLAFPDQTVGNAATLTETITSSGPQGLNLGTLSLAGSDANQYSLVSDGCSGRGLAQGSSCTFSVAFHPNGAGDFSNAQVDIGSDAPDAPYSVRLNGKGIAIPPPPTDRDNDGILDAADTCPGTPAGPLDSNHDGCPDPPTLPKLLTTTRFQVGAVARGGKVFRFIVTGAARSTKLAVICRKRCGRRDKVIARGTASRKKSRPTSIRLRRVLRPGAVIEVRATQRGIRGRYATFKVLRKIPYVQRVGSGCLSPASRKEAC